MPLTPEEQKELDYLEGLYGPQTPQEKGQEKAATFRNMASKQRQEGEERQNRAISWWRVFAGGGRDAVQGQLDTTQDYLASEEAGRVYLNDYMGSTILSNGLMGTTLGRSALSVLGVAGDLSRNKSAISYKRLELPNFKGSEDAGWAEQALRGIVSFTIPFTGYMKATNSLRAYGLVGRLGQGLAAGAATDFTQFEPVAGNIANVLRDGFGIDSDMLDSLASEDDDARLMQRFKAAAAGAPLGLVGDAAFEAGGRLLKAYRGWKGTVDEADAIVENLKKGPVALDQPKALPSATTDLTVTKGAADNLAQDGARAAKDGEIPVVEADEVLDPVDKELGFKSREFDDFDDVLDFLKSKAGDPNLSDDAVSRMAQHLMEGDPENALARLGIDPLKIDFSKWDNEALLGRLHKGLGEIYETLASRLGRSNIRVSELAIVRGAEAFGSDPGVLKSLYKATENLPELLMGSRLFVGAHAAKLLSHAERALADLKAGKGTGEAWNDFLEAFYRQAYYLGSIRGAGSEIARALRSLQTVPSAGKRLAAEVLEGADSSEAALQRLGGGGAGFDESARTFAETLQTDADRIRALQRLIDLRGDAGELSRTTREMVGSFGQRVNQAYRETTGNLFTAATAFANTFSGISFMGLNGLGRIAAAIARAPLGLLGGRAEIEAKRALYEAWAYNEALIGGWGTAFRETWKLLQREGLSEAAINLDGLGLRKLAAKAEARSSDVAGQMVEHFERTDVVHTKKFALTTAETRELNKWAEEHSGFKLLEYGLKGWIRLVSASVNAAGTLARTGTTAFINAPDQLVGTVGAQAGAKARAVQMAALEAAELNLTGKELSEFIKARTVQAFGNGPETWGSDLVQTGERYIMARAGETEAKMVLFQDDIETGFMRSLNATLSRTTGLGGIITSTLLPFFKTLTRIVERTAFDFTPLGLIKQRIRKAIAAGGSQRDEAVARMSLSAVLMMSAFQMAQRDENGNRMLVGNDGGYRSTARDADRPSYSLKIGDDAVEFNRLDPIGTILGIAADLAEYYDAAEESPQRDSTIQEGLEAMFWSINRNIFSKTWMTSLDGIMQIVSAKSPEETDDAGRRFMANLAGRVVPGAGVQKVVENASDGTMREARSFVDGLLRSSVGADKLPVKRDFLGRPLKLTEQERIVGLKGGIQPWEGDDPLNAEMARLSLTTAKPAWTQDGVTLNPTQYSRFLEIRGQEVVDPTTGLTMQKALEQLIKVEGYDELPHAAKVQAWRDVISGYTALAKGQMVDEYPDLGREWLKTKVWQDAAKQGWQPDRRDAELAKLKSDLGL